MQLLRTKRIIELRANMSKAIDEEEELTAISVPRHPTNYLVEHSLRSPSLLAMIDCPPSCCMCKSLLYLISSTYYC